MTRRGSIARVDYCIGVAVLFSAALFEVSLAGKPDPRVIPVTSIISDYDSGVGPALQIQSDKLGAYIDSAAVGSNITTNATGTVWGVDSSLCQERHAHVVAELHSADSGHRPERRQSRRAALGDAYMANFGSNCHNFSNSFWTLPAGQTMQCPMDGRFDYGGQTYALHMNHNTNFPETDTGVCDLYLSDERHETVLAVVAVAGRHLHGARRRSVQQGQHREPDCFQQAKNGTEEPTSSRAISTSRSRSSSPTPDSSRSISALCDDVRPFVTRKEGACRVSPWL